MKPVTSRSIAGYIAAASTDVRPRLRQMRATIHKAAPGAVEKISYGIPTYDLNGNLVHFAAFKAHIGFYPGASGIAAFQAELKDYKSAKGSVQFPLDRPLPLDLVARIVAFRVREQTPPSPRRRRRAPG